MANRLQNALNRFDDWAAAFPIPENRERSLEGADLERATQWVQDTLAKAGLAGASAEPTTSPTNYE
jgi:hypothetical protein